MPEFNCRAMHAADVATVIRIQAQAYIDDIQEADEVIRARFHQAPGASWVVERKGEVCGYLVGYRSCLGEVTPLGFRFCHKPEADTLYLHDLAICPSATGHGLGPRIVQHALAEARQQHLRHAALVAVQNSKRFWEKLGFRALEDLGPHQQAHLRTYAGPAHYMARPLIARGC